MSNSSAKRIEDALNSLEESNKKNFDEIKKENSELNKEKNIIFTNYWPPVLIFIKIFKIIKKDLRKIYLPNRLLDFYLV